MLYLSVQYLWLMWLGRDIEWTFPRLLAAAGPAVALALAARVSKVDTAADAPPPREQYFIASPAMYGLLAVFPLLITLTSFLSELRDMIPDPPNLLAVTLVRGFLFLVYMGLAVSTNERIHWLGLFLMWIAAFGFIARLGLSLSGAAA